MTTPFFPQRQRTCLHLRTRLPELQQQRRRRQWQRTALHCTARTLTALAWHELSGGYAQTLLYTYTNTISYMHHDAGDAELQLKADREWLTAAIYLPIPAIETPWLVALAPKFLHDSFGKVPASHCAANSADKRVHTVHRQIEAARPPFLFLTVLIPVAKPLEAVTSFSDQRGAALATRHGCVRSAPVPSLGALGP